MRTSVMLWATAVTALGPLPRLRAQDWTTPDASMRTMLRALAEKRCDVLWGALPRSYQADVEDLVRTFAARMDREVWDATVAAARAAVAVLEAQRDRCLRHDLVASFLHAPDGARNYDLMVGALGRLLDSDVARLDKLAKADIPALLRAVGADLIACMSLDASAHDRDKLAKLDHFTVETLTESDDRATVRLTTDGDDEKVKMSRVDGRWVPAAMAEAWQRKVKRLRKLVDGIQIDADTAARAKTGLSRAIESLQQMEGATSDEDFGLALHTTLLNLQHATRGPRPAKAAEDSTAPQPGR